MGEVLVLLTGDTSCYIQGILNDLYYIARINNGKVGCLLIVNGDRNLVIDIKDRLVLGNGEEAFRILKSLELHEMILRALLRR